MFVGIDVSKDWVDVAVHPTGETWHVGLDEEAVDGLVRKLRDLGAADRRHGGHGRV